MTARRDRLGLVQWFRPGEFELVEACIEDIGRLGIDRLRTHLSWADYYRDGGQEWCTWLLATLARHVDVLPCLHYTPPSLAESGRTSGPPRELRAFADFIDHIITCHGDHFEAVELWNEPNNLLDWDWRLDTDWLKFCTMVGSAAHWARCRGKRVVLGGPCPTDLNWLRLMGQRGILATVDAVGVHGFPGTWDSVEGGLWPGWQQVIDSVRETVAPFNDSLEVWITEAGYSTWRHDPFAQVRNFLDATEATADRLYWYGLRDIPLHVPVQEGLNFDVRHYHFGIHHADGKPKLLGRLLRDGLPAVQQLASVRRPVAVVGSKPPLLITGGAGFIGCNLADRLASEGENVLVYDSLHRSAGEVNLAWLRKRHPRRISAAIADIRDKAALGEAVGSASTVFHLAAQVAVTTSMQDPYEDMQVNLLGTVNLLEALRRAKQPCIFASTNKVYGELLHDEFVCIDGMYAPTDARIRKRGVDEEAPLDFRTPYGCSKGAADQYMLDYARNFGVPTAIMRMSCIYGPRQDGCEDQGWVAHFLLRALAGQSVTIFGDGRQVRDILFVDDAVNAYVQAWRNIGRVAGQAFNLGGGVANAVSLLQVIQHISGLLERPVELCFAPWRPDDQRWYVSDPRRVRAALNLPPPVEWRTGIEALLRHFNEVRTMPNPTRSRVGAARVASG